jgi:rod shape determining protein RodA
MCLAGLVNIYSSNYNPEKPEIYNLSQEYGKQLLWFVISITLGFLILLLEGNFLRKFVYEFYGIVITLLIAVLLVGVEKNGAKAWFGFGGFGIQPAEFAKVSVSLAIAKYLSQPGTKLQDSKTRINTFLFILAPALLIMLQPDAGTVIVFASYILVLYREGMGGNFLLFGLFAAIIATISLILKDSEIKLLLIPEELPGQWALSLIMLCFACIGYIGIKQQVQKRQQAKANLYLTIGLIASICIIHSVDYGFEKLLKPHQKERVEILLGLRDDPDGKGYNIDRSKAAIGSGGFTGKGYMNATLANAEQKHVPMQSTDFIFCTLSEEWGFIGSFGVLILFGLFLIRIIYLAERQRSAFTRIYAYCVACIIFFHVMINIGMAIGLAPVIGIPLPFFSYGGSSLMAFSMMVFILLKLDSERLEVLR